MSASSSSSIVKAAGRETLRYLGGRKKLLNPNPAIDLIAKHPAITVKENTAHCDGGHANLGHPRVYLNLDKGQNTCNYCGQKFNYDKSHSH